MKLLSYLETILLLSGVKPYDKFGGTADGRQIMYFRENYVPN